MALVIRVLLATLILSAAQAGRSGPIEGYDVATKAVSRTGAASGSGSVVASQSGQAYYGYRVVNAYPHDSRAYTQGLVYRDGFLYESTGLNGRSTLRKVALQTGQVV